MIRKTISVVLLTVVMAGCSVQEPRTVYVDKPVPVYTVPAPPHIERPVLPIHSSKYSEVNFLTNPTNIGQIVQDFTLSLRLVLNYAQAMEQILQTYQDLSERNFADQPGLFSTSSGETPLFASSQIELQYRASIAFSDIVDKYEEQKEEILSDETE